MATQKDIAKLIAVLSAAFPNWSANEFTAEVYYQDLKEYPSDLLESAATMCRTEPGRKFAPSVGEILGAVIEIRKKVDNIPDAYQAWEDLLKAGRGVLGKVEEGNVIVYYEYKFLHPLVKRVAESFGWPDRFPGPMSNEVSDRSQYIKAYEIALGKMLYQGVMPESVGKFIEEKRTQAPLLEMKNLTNKLEKK